MSTALLSIDGLHVSYGKVEAVHGVALALEEGRITTVIGANGAGKSSLLNALVGSVPSSGNILWRGEAIERWPIERRVEAGLCLVPERRELFADMSVSDNLALGAFAHRRDRSARTRDDLEWVLGLFPRLKERLQQRAGTLSGGEQQMLALGRALMARPTLLMLDEPSLGLAPIIVREIFKSILSLRERGLSLLIVEQNARLALQAADDACVMEGGEFVLTGPAAELALDPRVEGTYLGQHGRSPTPA